mmetsp:Transcript_32230/g.99805  ORF Transcript_32230/g.99805 Transcript_32230/m.99805 type:complete len:212 (-) Transcript_32230:1119-1754(-)
MVKMYTITTPSPKVNSNDSPLRVTATITLVRIADRLMMSSNCTERKSGETKSPSNAAASKVVRYIVGKREATSRTPHSNDRANEGESEARCSRRLWRCTGRKSMESTPRHKAQSITWRAARTITPESNDTPVADSNDLAIREADGSSIRSVSQADGNSQPSRATVEFEVGITSPSTGTPENRNNTLMKAANTNDHKAYTSGSGRIHCSSTD